MELILGAMLVAWLVTKTIPTAVSDFVTTMRASKAGQWDLIDKDRDRRAARAEARRKAIADLRARRNRQAGGDGTYRPGLAAYLADVYHGLWEDQLEARRVKRANRPPIGPDGSRPTPGVVDRAVESKVRRQREKTGYLGRAVRLLIDPVGEPRPATPHDNTAQEPDGEPEWLTPDPDEDAGSTVVHGDTSVSYTKAGKWAWSCRRADCNGKGFDYATNGEAQAAAAAHRCLNTGNPPAEGVQIIGKDDGGLTAEQVLDVLMGEGGLFTGMNAPLCERCGRVQRLTDGQVVCPCRPVQQQPDNNQQSSNLNEGADMNTATGDVHDVETCKTELTALADDLTRVDTALDVVDEAIRQAKAATESVEAWLRSKNADACVPGMAAALDALSSDHIKELIDAVAVAKQGVADTVDNLAPLEEAAELVGGTDGSALNGR
ncbi:hypothetical protein AB0B63_07055 [Micromonospora sp. NPDC049081]|uniref:hypothetical protein n=1 Tax=Micromonospora sp. NPDC049081 TaxID=3155150 RepID=UPI0033C54FC9